MTHQLDLIFIYHELLQKQWGYFQIFLWFLDNLYSKIWQALRKKLYSVQFLWKNEQVLEIQILYVKDNASQLSGVHFESWKLDTINY